MTSFNNPSCCVEVGYVLVSSHVTQEDSRKVMEVKLAALGAGAFHAHPRTKLFQVGNIGFPPEPTFEGFLPVAECTRQLCRYTAWSRVAGQNLAGIPEP
jgi:hypothetical protein